MSRYIRGTQQYSKFGPPVADDNEAITCLRGGEDRLLQKLIKHHGKPRFDLPEFMRVREEAAA